MNETTQLQQAAKTNQKAIGRAQRVRAKWLRFARPLRNDQDAATTGDYIFWSILAAGVLITALVTYFKGDSSTQAQVLVKDFNTMANDASNMYTGNWANFSTVNADNSGLFKNYTAFTDNGGGSVLVRPGGGTLTAAPGTLNTANDAGQYTITEMPFEGCKTFVSGVAKNAGSVSVNGTVVKAYGGTFSPQLMQCKDTGNTIIVVRA